MNAKTWTLIGFVGQGFFFFRFLLQWIASERKKQSIIPVSFWYFSLMGGTIILAYSIYRRDPVFIAGQGISMFVYLRNLWFIHKKGFAAE